MQSPAADREAILGQLGRILSSEAFKGSERSRKLLRFVVERTADGHADAIKEYTLGTEVFGRPDTFDPRTDPIVRAEASRLRQRLELYYATEGRSDSLSITLPRGSYIPEFGRQASAGEAAPAPTARSLWPWQVATAILAIALALALWALLRTPPTRSQRPVRLDVDLGPGRFVGSEVGVDVALSPDGNWMVFVGLDSGGIAHLFKRQLDQSDSTEIAGSEGARGPFFSPDGNWIAFWAGGKLKKTLLDGGSPITLCDATDLLGASWGDDGYIVASLGATSRLYRISSEGGNPALLVDMKKDSMVPVWPQVLPGSKAVLFTTRNGPSDSGIIGVFSLPDQKSKILARGGTYARYLADGHLIYVNRGRLFAVLFRLDRLELRGAPVPIVDDVAYSTLFGYAQFDCSRSGMLVYRRGPGKSAVRLAWIDRSGKPAILGVKPGIYQFPRLSPDGHMVSVSVVDGEHEDIWALDLRTEKLSRVTNGDRNYFASAWTPDGRSLILAARDEGLFWVALDGSHRLQPLIASKNIQTPWSFTPDGKRLAYYELAQHTGFDIWTVPIENTGGELHAGKPEVFVQTKGFEVYPAFSPDGRWLAYGSNESGTSQVYVRAFPGNGKVIQVSTKGGRIPAWSPGSHELLFRTDEQQIMAANYRVNRDSISVQEPRLWVPLQLADTGVVSNFDAARDGKSVLALLPVASPDEPQAKNHVTFFLNFFDELERRSPQPRR